MEPLVTVVISARDRPGPLPAAIASALAQTEPRVEVVVVDDGSDPPLEVAADPRVRVLRNEIPRRVSHARNLGLHAARGRFVTFLDDDDTLHQRMVERALRVVHATEAASVCTVEVVDGDGRVLDVRVPPSSPRGGRFGLDPPPPGRSVETKQGLLAPTAVLAGLGGFDEALPFKERLDAGLRLNAVCPIVAVEEPGYRLTRDDAAHVSRDAGVMSAGFTAFERKHAALLAAHPEGYADALLGHARLLLGAGAPASAARAIARAARIAPRHTAKAVADPRRVAKVVRDRHVVG